MGDLTSLGLGFLVWKPGLSEASSKPGVGVNSVPCTRSQTWKVYSSLTSRCLEEEMEAREEVIYVGATASARQPQEPQPQAPAGVAQTADLSVSPARADQICILALGRPARPSPIAILS